MPNLLQIIMYLVNKIKWQNNLIQLLNDYIAWLEDEGDRPSKGTDITDLDYNKLTLDDPPKVVKVERVDYKSLLKQALNSGKPIKPIRRYKSSSKIYVVPNVMRPKTISIRITGLSDSTSVRFVLLYLAKKIVILKMSFSNVLTVKSVLRRLNNGPNSTSISVKTTPVLIIFRH
ncbi:hypothetical protein [Alkalibacterium sp. MB6]|uniref:hypothetical protein n=1 Tax=Alkalibacterium sp. MB6 TaxID=2081965 RepID=UPI00137A4E33|nr:hypothetical protein [Alkalibacterium sp. MB6]